MKLRKSGLILASIASGFLALGATSAVFAQGNNGDDDRPMNDRPMNNEKKPDHVRCRDPYNKRGMLIMDSVEECTKAGGTVIERKEGDRPRRHRGEDGPDERQPD